MSLGNNDMESLAHAKWRCQYHNVFAPKYRRQAIYGKYRQEIGKMIRQVCERNDVEIIQANACPDHIHMLVSIPPKMSVSRFMIEWLSSHKEATAQDVFRAACGIGNEHFPEEGI